MIIRLSKSLALTLFSVGMATLLSGCSSSSPPNPVTGTTTGKTGEKAPTETVKANSEEDPKAKAAVESLEKSGAKLVRREGAVVRVELGPEGSDADLALLKDLPTVEALVADKRGVTDKGLESLAGHPGLKTLDLTLSGITNAGLSHLANLPKLEEVNLKRCDVSAAGYESLAKVATLKRIRAAQSNFDGACLAAIKDCALLEMLDLQDCNKVPTAEWKPLENFKKLKFLRIWGRGVDDSVMDYIKDAKSLKILSLDVSSVGIDGLKKISHLPLQELYLNDALNITSDALEAVGNFKGLTKLELRSAAVGNKGMAHLAGLTQLKVLDLTETAVGDKGLEHLQGLTNLEELNLMQTTTTDAGLVFLAPLKKLRWLKLDKCRISAEGTPQLKGLTNLEYLHIGSSTKPLDDAALEPLGELKNLRTLVITFLPEITDEGVNKLKAKLPGLKDIQR
jgi:Leucine-rich repeat (LRR) protein